MLLQVLNWASDHPILAVLLTMIIFGNLGAVIRAIIAKL